MKILGCSDRADRMYRNTSRGKWNRKVAVRKFRQQVRVKLKAGEYEKVPVSVSRDYND